jgi:pimeloyl-ACP methyl ester carboxylesterase
LNVVRCPRLRPWVRVFLEYNCTFLYLRLKPWFFLEYNCTFLYPRLKPWFFLEYNCTFLYPRLKPWATFATMNWKKIRKWTIIILIIYVVIGVAFYFLQDRILFHPVTLKRGHKYEFSEPHKDLSIPISNEDTLNLVQFLSKDTVTKGIVLYFHGNKKNIAWYSKYAPYFTKQGYEVFMIDYPGFGKSTGRFNEQTLYDWALQTYKLARSRYSSDSIIVYGKSMGTGIAAQLASIRDCKRVILETPYYDFPSVVKNYLPIYPLHRMLHYQLPTNQYITKIIAPISIFQGTKDRVINYRNAKRLEPLLKPTDEFISVKGGKHNDLFEHPIIIKKLDSLLKL